jgi:CheY-like chemotaxis protein
MNDRASFGRFILVIDDDPFVLETLSMLLGFEGHNVATAVCGAEALAMFEPGKYDLVFTDFFMPAMTGDKVAAAIKSRAPTQPVIALSAFVEKINRAPAPWFDCCIAKPFELHELRQAIEYYSPVLLDRHNARI